MVDFRSQNLSELVPRIDEDALLLGRSHAAGARLLVGGAGPDVDQGHVAFTDHRKIELILVAAQTRFFPR